MHFNEVETDEFLVRRLLTAQFPEWADLPIQRVLSMGTDNAIYRLGEAMAVRLPRIDWAVGQVEKEQEWLPILAPLLPLKIPLPLAKGEPGEGYPWPWSVCTWLEGRDVATEKVDDLDRAASDLSMFLSALHRIDSTGGPVPGSHNSHRGEPLANRDDDTRRAIGVLAGMVDAARVTEVWEFALSAPEWQGPAVWIHGDLSAGNLLATKGRLSAVIDFGCAAVGDPACDLMVAWTLFAGDSREVFRALLAPDDAMWARGRGWALSRALIYIPYYLDTNPSGVELALHTIEEAIGA